MSRTVYWRRVAPLEYDGTVELCVVNVLELMYNGELPTRLSEHDVPYLRGAMAHAQAFLPPEEREEAGRPYQHIISAIERHGEIELKVEY